MLAHAQTEANDQPRATHDPYEPPLVRSDGYAPTAGGSLASPRHLGTGTFLVLRLATI